MTTPAFPLVLTTESDHFTHAARVEGHHDYFTRCDFVELANAKELPPGTKVTCGTCLRRAKAKKG